eukprot:TRINITY_DN4807_c0_g1_i1.p1 TRINITY_DN4807_c0_g1~~TRINITY_DN4807_c0_g1_i1.p1  ORF type:complete len:832 (+),score=159.81 TRINITY_DN4807_c0_g1_i1:101-2497(+)
MEERSVVNVTAEITVAGRGRGRRGRGRARGRGRGRGRGGKFEIEKDIDQIDDENQRSVESIQNSNDSEPLLSLSTIPQRILSSISFVEDWKSYGFPERASSKTVKFCGQPEGPQPNSNVPEMSIPQFSSASVPKVDDSCVDEFGRPVFGHDFILNAGGSVWALDWCPKSHKNSQTNCEYLAIGAHQPGSMYHKLGLSLSGKGIVQIWSVHCHSEWKKQFATVEKQRKRKRKQEDEDAVYNAQKHLCLSTNGNATEHSCFQESVGVLREKMNEMLECVVEQGRLLEHGTTTHVFVDGHDLMLDNMPECKKQKGKERVKDKARSKVVNDVVPSGITTDSHNSHLVSDGENCNYKVNCMSTDLGNVTLSGKDIGQLPSDISKEYKFPRMVLCLTHEGQVVWDLKWQPLDDTNLPSCHSLGFLAVLLGDGSMQVWEVPLPSVVNFLYSTKCSMGSKDPRFVKLKPVFNCSKLQSAGHQSIPLTLEWSNASPHDLLLVGCHDGTVAMWKFSINTSLNQDRRPLVSFIADSLAIRTLAWAPTEGDPESKNIIVTGGHSGSLRFWDLSCIILSMDDGSLRILSLSKAAVDTPVTGKAYCGTQFQGLQGLCCSSFTITSVHASRLTGLVAYSNVDGSTIHFQLTKKIVEKGRRRHGTPHYLCGSFIEDEDKSLKVVSPTTLIDLQMKKTANEKGNTAVHGDLSEDDQVFEPNAQIDVHMTKNSQKNQKKKQNKEASKKQNGEPCVKHNEVEGQKTKEGAAIESFPSKQNAVYKARWNSNRGCEQWLCYGGASGIVRCQEIRLVFEM